jgi:SPOR domain
MADDHNQRPYRTNGPAGTGAGASAGSDPLAELARLIGQNDPFSEFGRPAAPRAPAAAAAPAWPPQSQPAPQAVAPPAAPSMEKPFYGAPGFAARQPYGNDLYQVDPATPVYGEPLQGPAEFEAAPFHADHADPFNAQFPGGDAGHDEFYDDVPPNRRRIGIIAIAGVFALAVIGTAGAFGYRAIFGSSSSLNGPPPVITADGTPSKIVPAAASKDAQANKVITDRVNDRGQGEKLVSREEQPVSVLPAGSGNGGTSQSAALPQLGSGIVGGGEPKRVRTIVIHPDGTAVSQPAPAQNTPSAQSVEDAPAPARVSNAAAPPPQRIAAPQQPQPTRAQQAAAPPPRPAAPAPQAAPPPRAAANAPLSLNPNDSAAPAPAPVQRSAAVAPPARVAPAPASSGGGYVVQVSSQRSEADAQAAFQSLQGKFPGQLGGKQPLVKRVDLGAKGIYFRAMVGPYGDQGAANELCSSLKAAGGSCLVQRN